MVSFKALADVPVEGEGLRLLVRSFFLQAFNKSKPAKDATKRRCFLISMIRLDFSCVGVPLTANHGLKLLMAADLTGCLDSVLSFAFRVLGFELPVMIFMSERVVKG